jgi:transposase
MEFKAFVGIDVSKSTIDVWLKNVGKHNVFPNSMDGFKAMVEWIMDCLGPIAHEGILFGFEHTGLYSEPLSSFLDDHKLRFTVIPGLELKRSLGIRRGKSDRADSRDIAEYVYEKREKVKLFKRPSENLGEIRRLASYRERLVKERAAFKARMGEYLEMYPEGKTKAYVDSHEHVIACLDKEIKDMEAEMGRLVREDRELSRQYRLINSIKGIGPQTALVMIVLTKGFSSFADWRKFASYAGIAPFPNQSGTFTGRTKTSKLANRRIKALLTMCAAAAIKYNTEMRLYFEKRVAEGKNKMSTINIIRNKLVSRIFAVVQRNSDYVDVLKYAA